MNEDLQIAIKTVRTQILALKKLSASFGRSMQFSKAVSLLSKMKGKCLVVGVGKSHLIGLKISATLSSLGTPSVAFSANDLQHGGLGAIQKNLTNEKKKNHTNIITQTILNLEKSNVKWWDYDIRRK